ncbi:MAG: LysM peptidoglycan-binding domain-containing protein [Chloroflexi bacterium]|nr:LysM peptidoglycan-binding domain-containing protein [Chloroflexota bacterium]
MQGLRQMGGGLVLALLSVVIVLGGISLALAEGYVPPPSPTPTQTQPAPTVAPTETPSATLGAESPVHTSTSTATSTLAPSVNCPPPPGWTSTVVQLGDTLDSLAARYHTTAQELMTRNCMTVSSILPGYIISVPIQPTATYYPCGVVPFGWIQYTVQPGDNLYQISLRYGVTVAQLDTANCLRGSTNIFAGQRLWVPNVPIIPTATPIIIEFATQTPPIPTSTTAPPPASTETPSATTEPSATPTETPTPSETPTPTDTPPPTETPTPPTP